LLDAVSQEGLISRGSNAVSLTAAGWKRINPSPEIASEAASEKSQTRSSSMPPWVNSLKDEPLKGLLLETYRALEVDLLALPMMGARAAFDRAMELKLDGDYGTFPAKLKAMQEAGFLDSREAGILGQMIDAGNAAAHRAWQPTRETVDSVIGEAQHTIWNWFVRDDAASAVKAATPPRPPRR
jgi:hypothetical protein